PGRVLFLDSDLLEHGLHFADRERDADEDRHEDHRWQGEDDLDPARGEEVVEPPAPPEQQHAGQADRHGRERERQIDQGVQERPAAEALPYQHPRDDHAERGGDGHGDQRDHGGQGEGVHHIGSGERVAQDPPPGPERLPDDAGERREEEHREVQHAERDQHPAQHGSAAPPAKHRVPIAAPPDGEPGAHGCPPLRPRASRVVINTVPKEIANRTEATAAACSGLNWDASWKIRTGAVRVRPVMLPETITTLPNSPSERANTRSAPAAIAGRIAGSTIRRNVVQPLAPRVSAASSSAGSSSRSTGWTARTTNGRVTTRSASRIPSRANATSIPAPSRARPIGDAGP